MKKLLVIALIYAFNSAKGATYYFSAVSGDDNRTPAQAQNPSTPWKTTGKLNEFFKSLQPGDIILFKRGEVFEGAITVSKSGSPGSPITLSSYGEGSKPVISGFATLSNWVSVGRGLYESYNQDLGASVNMLTVNNAPQAMGRYPNSNAPNKGYLTFESHTGNISITDNQLSDALNWTGAQLVVRTNRYVIDKATITDHSGNTIKYSPPLHYAPINGYGYFIQNDIKTLDQPGEWYYNPSTKKVTMYFGTANPSSYKIKASAVDTLFNMYNLDNIIVKDLAFEGANKRAMNFYSVDIGVTKVLNCDIRYSGIEGIVAGTSRNIIIDGCTVTDSNVFGINLSGGSNYTVTGNTVKRIALFPGMAGTVNTNTAIKCTGGNSLIEANVVDSVGYVGIRFTGDLVTIRKNFIQHYCMILDDGGGIYTSSPAGAALSNGRKIVSNIVVNGSSALEGTTSTNGATNGIYLDDNTSGVIVDSNTVANNNLNGIYLHNNFAVTATNNTVYNSSVSGLRLVHNQSGSNFRNIVINDNILVAKLPGQSTFFAQTDASDPDFTPWGNIDRNFHASPRSAAALIKAVRPGSDQSSTLADWHKISSFEQHASAPKSFADDPDPDKSVRFEYNPTSSIKTVKLNKQYIDIKDHTYSGTVTLQPFTSLVLLPGK